jgi:hypothetical protein
MPLPSGIDSCIAARANRCPDRIDAPTLGACLGGSKFPGSIPLVDSSFKLFYEQVAEQIEDEPHGILRVVTNDQ